METSSKIALGAAAVVALVLAKKKSDSVSGVGAVLWEYALMECDQKGIDLSKDYFEQYDEVLREIEKMRKKFGYRQSASSKAMGRTDRYSFYLALQRKAGY